MLLDHIPFLYLFSLTINSASKFWWPKMSKNLVVPVLVQILKHFTTLTFFEEGEGLEIVVYKMTCSESKLKLLSRPPYVSKKNRKHEPWIL